MSDLVYHYCTIDSFIKIVEGKNLKFSDIKKSNDALEIELIWQHFYSYIGKQSSKGLKMKVARFFKDEQMKNTDFLACCFSTEKDALHMWNCYANKGVAIGFNKEMLEKWSKTIKFIGNCIYLEDSQSAGIAACGEIQYYDKKSIEGEVENMGKSEFITDYFKEVFEKAMFYKTSFWKEEKEWRIVLPIIYSENNNLDLENNIETDLKISIKSMTNEKFGVVSYCLIPFEATMIKEIILAPNCNASKNDVSKILRANGIFLSDNQIIESNGSLR